MTVSSHVPARDQVDVTIEDWGREQPDVDPDGLGVVGRIHLLSKHLRANDKRVLAGFGLEPWAFEVIAALRRQGPPFQLTPTQLRRLAVLSSGAMTNRLDRLEAQELVARSGSPDDRRSLVITLTEQGCDLADRANAARLDAVSASLRALTEVEQNQVSDGLRKLLVGFARA